MTSSSIQLDTSLRSLSGVGEVIYQGLTKLNLHTVRDLLEYYPLRWEDYSSIMTISQLRPGTVTIYAKVESLKLKRTARRGFTIVEAVLSDDTGITKAIWFNQSYVAQSLREHKSYYFAGPFAFKSNNVALHNPTFSETLTGGKGGKIVPIYSQNAQVTSVLIRKLIDQVINVVDQIAQIIPEDICRTHQLLPRAQAISQIHQPANSALLAAARRSLAFEEIFLFMTAGQFAKQRFSDQLGQSVALDETYISQLVQSLPFKLTNAQRRVSWQLLKDMARTSAMNRMIQGDVGSGKTIVAFIAAASVAHANQQAVLMVPTAILASQHTQLASELLTPFGIKVACLTSATPSKERAQIIHNIAVNNIQLVIGTHSLLNDKIVFSNLNLVIVDEQHRFGVMQRKAILQKAGHTPHMMSMTATPIPRSLALVVYSELSISILDEMPPNRRPIITKLFLDLERANAYAQIDEQITLGRQVYVVCAQIDESDGSGVKSVKKEFDKLNKTIFAHRRVGLLHGKLSTIEKNQIMTDFASGAIDILVSTTVIEVGVNVPNASVIMIEDADRFGLATLHQLRGRVGRAEHQSFCYLFTSANSENAVSRLSALERTHDGLRLAQIDLENRGAGEIFGTLQHGKFNLRMADLTDVALVAEVQSAVKSFFSKSNVLQYPNIIHVIETIAKNTNLN